VNAYIYANDTPIALQDNSGALADLPPPAASENLGRAILESILKPVPAPVPTGGGAAVGGGAAAGGLAIGGLIVLILGLAVASAITRGQAASRVEAESARRADQRTRTVEDLRQGYRRMWGKTLYENGIIDSTQRDHYERTGSLIFEWRSKSGDRGYTITGEGQDFWFAQMGHQVYIFKNAQGKILYVGSAGGAHGIKPDTFPDRLKAHIKGGKAWTVEAHTLTVISGLNEMERYALEEVTIKEAKAKGEAEGNTEIDPFSKKFPASGLESNAQSALSGKHNHYEFQVDPYFDRLTLLKILGREVGETDNIKKPPEPKK
jgi:hypothetical protein